MTNKPGPPLDHWAVPGAHKSAYIKVFFFEVREMEISQRYKLQGLFSEYNQQHAYLYLTMLGTSCSEVVRLQFVDVLAPVKPLWWDPLIGGFLFYFIFGVCGGAHC